MLFIHVSNSISSVSLKQQGHFVALSLVTLVPTSFSLVYSFNNLYKLKFKQLLACFKSVLVSYEYETDIVINFIVGVYS